MLLSNRTKLHILRQNSCSWNSMLGPIIFTTRFWYFFLLLHR